MVCLSVPGHGKSPTFKKACLQPVRIHIEKQLSTTLFTDDFTEAGLFRQLIQICMTGMEIIMKFTCQLFRSVPAPTLKEPSTLFTNITKNVPNVLINRPKTRKLPYPVNWFFYRLPKKGLTAASKLPWQPSLMARNAPWADDVLWLLLSWVCVGNLSKYAVLCGFQLHKASQKSK